MQVQAVNVGVNISNMFNSTNGLFCRLDGLTPAVREQQRVKTLKHLGLLDTETIPIFDEATQTAARFIEAPICILGTMVQDHLWLKSAVGLSRLGLMNNLASTRRISRQEAFSTYVVD
ncbi:MAG: histidine kinase, partial [Crocosphaera sp.]